MVIYLDAAHNQWMRLIERESQLAALHEYAREASQGQGRLAKRDQLCGALLRQISNLESLTVIAVEDVHWLMRQRWIC